jgi:hypothetical protein
VSKRVLLDEGVPRHLAAPIEAAGLFVTKYPRAWKQIQNGELLRRAEQRGFDVLITSDKNIYTQQNLRGLRLSIIVLPTNLRRQVMALAGHIIETIKQVAPRQYVLIELGGRRLAFDFDDPTRPKRR